MVVSNESTEGVRRAPKIPCRPLAAISMAVDWEAPPMAEARAKPITPIRSVRLGPIMSPMRPPNRSSPPKAKVYAVTTHWRSTLENPKERCAEGSAMIMMVVSRTTMS